MHLSHFLVYRDANRQWRWTLYANNGRKIANSGEGYINQQDCKHAIDLIADNTKGLTVQYAA